MTDKGAADMAEPRINLKTPWLAAVLAFLVPGAGHFYQGRYFKGAIYSICILGLFFAGMRMSEWKAVYVHHPRNKPAAAPVKLRWLQFAAQFGVGLPSLCALVQNYRYYGDDNEPLEQLDSPLSVPFEGDFRSHRGDDAGRVFGTMELEPAATEFGGRTVRGHFRGEREDGTPVEIELGGPIRIDAPVRAERDRRVYATVLAGGDAGLQQIGSLDGWVPRPVWNWFAVPLDVQQERDLHKNLGKFYELAMVFTWVAGLLNLLAIWDALEGPAYGYGDETETETTGAGGKTADVESKPALEPKPRRAEAEVTA